MARRLKIHHPLLDELRRADREAAAAFPSRYDFGLGGVGLILHEQLEKSPYEWCSPLNAWAFAGTGGNGVHYSLLAIDNRITPDSPVVVTNPGGGMGLSHVVGENLRDFLSFGLRRGYFALEQLAYDLDLTLRAYTDPAWEPTEKYHHSVGFGVDEHKQNLLRFLADRFGLKPWSDAGRFAELQTRVGSQMEWPAEPPA